MVNRFSLMLIATDDQHIFWIVTCNENEFNKVKPLYDSALKISGFNYGMKFKATVENTS